MSRQGLCTSALRSRWSHGSLSYEKSYSVGAAVWLAPGPLFTPTLNAVEAP